MPGATVMSILRSPMSPTEKDNLKRLVKGMQLNLKDVGVPNNNDWMGQVQFYVEARLPGSHKAMYHSNLSKHLGMLHSDAGGLGIVPGHQVQANVICLLLVSVVLQMQVVWASSQGIRETPDGKHQFKTFGPGLNSESANGFFQFREYRAGQKFCVALDCEMLYTTNGEEIGAISLVDDYGDILISEYIKPVGVVTDYRTAFSGLTASLLSRALYSAEDILRKMQTYIGPDTILVGHGIDKDMQCLRVLHRNVFDTGVVTPIQPYTGINRRKSLEVRVREEFSDSTFRASGGPHNCTDDAQYSMALARVDAGATKRGFF
ncbi:unnamed protein product [Notodromas monacha]|uniref:Exonuclease domain-containing protein n=1 Tax=Notodromas monacha TaxID=399045 RepID=A0A7R9BEN6_9CRUS|nr:unnamed protein product [Notodromas monacha]CAG0912782.1 unnamed protein product [Notodromas monacha]